MINAKKISPERLLALPLSLAVATSAAGLCVPKVARADTLDELQQRIVQSAASYDEAQRSVEELQEQIEANEELVAQIEAELPAKKQAAAESIRAQYKMQQSSGGLIELLLSSEDFNEVIANVRYLDRIAERNNAAIRELVSATDELDEARGTLASEKAQADSDAASAKQAMSEAVVARKELEEERARQAAAEAAEAQAALEAAAKAAEEAAAKAAEEAAEEEGAGDSGATFIANSGNEAKVEVPDSAQADQVVWSEKDIFVNNWAPRIDAYLSGSPLAGYGKTFAEAAWNYGVDPRLSPAISCVESSKGAVCFKPHNAWGWGSSSWSDWESAINDHVAGLAAGYGGQLSVATAQKYCPPTWENWYASVLSEMNSI